MSKFFTRIDDYLQHDNQDGEDNLLVVVLSGNKDGPLSGYAEALLVNVFEKAQPILGAWKRIVVVEGGDSVGKQVKQHGANHVLLMGKQLSRVIIKQSGLRPETNMLGVLINHKDRRWIVTPALSVYGVGKEAKGIYAAMMGHLYRHLELLRIGLIGWDNPEAPVNHRVVRNRDDWNELRGLLDVKRLVAIDTETNNLERINNTILTIQFGFDGHTGWTLPVHHVGSTLPGDVLNDAITYLKNYFENAKSVTHIYANAKFDLHQLYSLCKLRWYNHNVYDVQAGAFNLDEMQNSRFLIGYAKKNETWSLDRLCVEAGMSHYQNTEIGKGDRARLATVDLELVAKYGAVDVVLPIRLMRMQLALAKWRSGHFHGRPYKKFSQAVVQVDGAKIIQFVAMERNGLLVDRKYVVSLQGPGSPILKEIRDATAKLLAFPEVAAANTKLLSGRNVRSRSLFGAKGSQSMVFDPGKPAHQQMLFFDIMKLSPVNETKGGLPSVDDKFKAKYKANPVVAAFTNLDEAKKMHSTFIAGYFKILISSPDNKDGRLRTTFGYLNVKTGRSGSSNPNLQNQISRNKVRAKIVKRQFVARKGRLIIKDDYGAHEVRGWGIASNDPKIGETFWKGMQIRLRYEAQLSIPTNKVEWWAKQLKAGDVHYQGYALVNGVDVLSVTESQRGGQKKIIFGVTYGKGIPSLARDLGIEEPEAKRIHNLIFKKTFAVGGRWLETLQESAREHLVAKNLLGGVRHLWGHLHTERRIHGSEDRRTPNSVIQGPSSNLGFRGSYETRKLAWEMFESRGIDLDYAQCNAVHDSNESEGSIVNIPLLVYLRYHGATTMLHRWVRDTFDQTVIVGYEIDCEIGGSLATTMKAPRWDTQVAAIRSGIEWGNKELGWNLDVEAYMKIVEHNAKIIYAIRRREIVRQLKAGEQTNFYMEMTKENALSYGLIFKAPQEKAKTAVSKEPSKALMRELA